MNTRSKIAIGFLGVFLLVIGATSVSAGIATVAESVGANQGPWSTTGGLNSGFSYGIGDQASPVTISQSNGLDFTAGNTLMVQYVSGTVSGNPASVPFTDAKGNTANVVNNVIEPTGGRFPSFYFHTSDYPANANELVGTFANGSGQIVGTPFNVGDAHSLTIPAGATRLQLGINDVIFADNAGSLNISVSGAAATPTTAVPLPSATWPTLTLLGAISVAVVVRQRRAH